MKKIVLILFVTVLLCLPVSAQQDSVCLIRDMSGTCGSGAFIAKDRVLTAFHVVKGTRFRVEFKDRLYAARLLKSDESGDLAVIVLSQEVDVVPLALSDAVIGDTITFWGHPSAVWDVKHKEGKIFETVTVTASKKKQFHIDTPAAPGYSGGPVTDKDGRIVGVVSSVTMRNNVPVDTYACADVMAFIGGE